VVFPKSVAIKSEDPIVVKTYPDGFNKTDLDKYPHIFAVSKNKTKNGTLWKL